MSGLESTSPLRDRHRQFAETEAERIPVLDSASRGGAASGRRQAVELEYLPYAPPSESDSSPAALSGHGRTGDDLPRPACELLAAYGPVEPEYAAIRRGAALFDATFRGTIVVSGADRQSFLQRMLTQDLSKLEPGKCARAFWLNRKGRIEADLQIAHLPESEAKLAEPGRPARLVIDVDRTRAPQVVKTLVTFVFSEDVAIEDCTASTHRLELHGPAAARMLALAGASAIPAENEATQTELRTPAGLIPVILIRSDSLGERGWLIVVDTAHVVDVWDALVAVRDPHDERKRVRPIGWHAYNIARVEAGVPLFHVDFGPSNLPHETGVLRDRVSFKKGCYLGQEVVARMESLGRPKQMLVGLRPLADLLPVAGSQVFARSERAISDAGESALGGEIGDQVGTVTSSTLSPMLGAAPIAFAMVRTTHAGEGTQLIVNGEGSQCAAVVGPLRSWPVTEAGPINRTEQS
jgi:folate-binding protein YgfZ